MPIRIDETTPEAIEYLRSMGKQPPPAPPTRTAVATDEPEKRPCRYCGHTQADHMGPRCRGGIAGSTYASIPTYSTGTINDVVPMSIQISGPSSPCMCTVYAPKEK